MSDAIHSNLLLTVAAAVHSHVSPEHQRRIEAAVADWPHAKAFIEDAKHEAKAEGEPQQQRRGPPVTRRSDSAPPE